MFWKCCSFAVVILFSLGVVTMGGVLECYSCDSAEDSECATRPGQQLNVEECAGVKDECATVIVAGITRRGCLSRLYPNNYCPAPCDRCHTSLCNRNIYPADRLLCYQCVGADCVDVSKRPSLVLPCPFYHKDDRCYTNVISLQNVQRGCEYTNLPADCPNVCLKCNYNGCNNELGVHEESCLQCSYNRNNPIADCLRSQLLPVFASEKCVLPTSSTQVSRCSNKLMHGHTGKCYTYVNEQTSVVERGCSTLMPLYSSGKLEQCYGVNCNSECLKISCNICTSAGGSQGSYECRHGLALKAQQCAAGTFGCFSCEMAAELRRGCVDSVFSQQADEACEFCRNAEGCNRNSVRTCYHCSSLDSSFCAHWTGAVPQIEQRNCTAPDELCVSTLMTKSNIVYIIRGCASDLPECTDNDPFCARCNGSLCNTESFNWSTALELQPAKLESPEMT